ncbi:MAG: hypothetical protein KBD63_08320, partial [Bacteriovoracaceae bacterium]|nr:hypothetical protein [Bacteriovoracaceae bacterium]
CEEWVAFDLKAFQKVPHSKISVFHLFVYVIKIINLISYIQLCLIRSQNLMALEVVRMRSKKE